MRNQSGGGGGDSGSGDYEKEKQRLPEIISQWYYKHGLFLSSYPTCAASIAVVAILLCCYPLLNIPLPGTIPTKVVLPYEGKYSLFGENSRQKYGSDSTSYGSTIDDYKNYSTIVKNMFKVQNYSFYDPPFAWAHSSPMVYVQQIMLRTSVFPWTDDMNLMDAFRSPMYEVFKLLEIVRNHETEESKITLDNICLHVENIKRPHNEQIFPEYNCLVLSPANIWGQNIQNFTKDSNILNTVFTHHNIQKTKVSAAEMLFGLPMQDTGFKRYPLRSRSRVIQYAITLILNNNDMDYLNSLKSKLTKLYPLHQKPKNHPKDVAEQVPSIMYIYYPGEFRIMEFLPICTALILLFTYIYFSVRKIDVIRSRVVLAICSVITVLGSLTMSLGLCFFFGLTISLQSKEIFPYLVILVGLENCLVITKSVVSTDETFDVKIRVAQALSKEGWHISKTLLTEITILTIGLATFVPVIQEFCVFAIVGLISDFMLQMLLFSTILAMNIRQVEYTQEAKHIPKMMMMMTSVQANDGKKNDFKYFSHTPFHRSHSHPKLAFGDFSLNDGFNKRSSLTNDNQQRIPKRMKLVNFWARTRLFQRAFMIWMVVWICSIIYSSGFLQNFLVVDLTHIKSAGQTEDVTLKAAEAVTEKPKIDELPFRTLNSFDDSSNITDQLKKLRYPGFELNYYLSSFHWSSILKQYNISLSGRYVTILPAIKLSHVIKPEVAILLRNPQEKLIQNFQWKALAAALDPLDLIDDDNRESPLITTGGAPLVPKSPMEIILAIMLCAISVSVLCYTMVVFYRCICTRNYAEWRSSWNEPELLHPSGGEQILEGIPLQIDGHTHKIECLISDGANIVSSCLKGQIKVWDAKFGDHITTIDRANMQIAEYDERAEGEDRLFKKKSTSPIWCLDFLDNLIAVGCANGRMEFWETPSGTLKCSYQEEDKRSQGITHIHLTGDRVIVARLCGRLNFYRLETYYKGKQIDWGFTSAYRRTHVRTGSTGSIGLTQPGPANTAREEMKCTLEGVRIAHQQPITCMEVINGMVFTGSQDHTLKVYSVDNPSVEYTLHGHCSPITCLFVDRFQSGTGGSGSQNGLLCVWDLLTGVCMYNIQAHDGAITSLACAPSYVISLGIDERVCVWERFQGNLLSAINISNAYSNLLMLTPSLLVTCKLGSLMVWDVRTSEPAREVKLDCSNSQLSPKIMRIASNSVICDYGNQIRIVKFPIVADKCN